MTQCVGSILENISCVFEKNVHSIVDYSVLLMSVRSSWFTVSLQLVFGLSENGSIPDVAITGLAILTSTFAFVVPSAWNFLSLGKTGFPPAPIQSHFSTYVILSERPFLTSFPTQICFLSLHSSLFFTYRTCCYIKEHNTLFVSSTPLFTALSSSRCSEIVKQVCGYGHLEIRLEVLIGNRYLRVICIEGKFELTGRKNDVRQK